MSTASKEKLERLRARRRGYRGVCTKLKKTSNWTDIARAQNDDFEQCKVLAGQLEEELKLLNEIEDEILSICEVVDINLKSKSQRKFRTGF